MPCNLSAVCYIDQYTETFTNTNFIVNAVGIIFSRHQNMNIFIHITAFYPQEANDEFDLDRFGKGDIINVQGRFMVTETTAENEEIKIIKMLASSVCVLNLTEEDLPRSPVSIVLAGIVKNGVEKNDNKITFGFTAKEYISDQISGSLEFNLYHFADESHLSPITSKVTRGSSLYITGFLSFVENLLLVKVTQVNFMDSTSFNSRSNFAWEKKIAESNSRSPTTTQVAKSILMNSAKPKQKGKRKGSASLTQNLKVPRLASLSMTTNQNEAQSTNADVDVEKAD